MANEKRGWRGVRVDRGNEAIVLAEVDAKITYNPNAGVGARWTTITRTSTFDVVAGADRELHDLEDQVNLPAMRHDETSEHRWRQSGLKQACWDEYKAYMKTIVPV